MSIKHTSTGSGTEVTVPIWEEDHTVVGSLEGVSNATYEKTMFFDVDGKTYAPSDYTLGNTTKEGSTDSGNDRANGSTFTMTEDGTPVSITCYLKHIPGYTPGISYAVVRVSDRKVMAYTGAWTITVDYDDWKTLNIDTVNENLAQGVEYYILVWRNAGQAYIYWATESGKGWWKSSPGTFPTWPDPFPALTGDDRRYSIYCTYTPLVYSEIPATRAKVANDYVKPAYARIIARAGGDEAGTKKLKIHDGNADVAEVTWTGSTVQDLVSSWTAYTDTTDRTMSVWFQRASAAETFTLYNVALEMRRDPT